MQKVKWIVIEWKKLGRQIGFRTANISLKNSEAEDWTYRVNVQINSSLSSEERVRVRSGAWVYRKGLNLFEVHIFDFNDDIYGEEIEVILLEKIRENKKISSLEELKSLIQSDIYYIKNNKFIWITFGTFDNVHLWHRYYLENAHKYCDFLVTIIATDKNVHKIKWKFPKNKQQKRLEEISKLWISDKVILWDENNPMKWIQEYKPSVVCFWYDQNSFNKQLEDFISDNNMKTEIIKISPFKEDIYKSSKL